MHYFQFNIGDYARSTRHLSDMEDLAYRRLLDMYYENEAPIPLETHWVARRIRMDTQTVEIVLQDMFEETKEGWKHARCDAEIAEYQARVERNRANGKRGGRPKTKVSKSDKNPVGSQSQPSRNPKQEPITNNHITIPKGIESSDDDTALSIDEVVEAWNQLAEQKNLAKIVKLTPERKRKVIARIREHTIEEWSDAMSAINRSKFLCGENDRGWKANFDFLLQPSSFVKLLEGAYDR